MPNKKILTNRMVLVPSKSRYDLSIDKWENDDTARQRFKSPARWDEVVESNLRQKQNLSIIEQDVPDALSIDRSELTTDVISDNDLFVFLGGDDHFSYCNQVILQYMRDNPGSRKYVAGVVLDNQKSWGGILYFDPVSFLKAIGKFKTGHYEIENWTTLEAKVQNGSETLEPFPSTWGYYIGEYCRLDMSRNVRNKLTAHVDGLEILPEKSSGVLVVTGAGSGPGSWYNNIHQCYFGVADQFGKEKQFARVIATENKTKAKCTLERGQTLKLVSYNDARGIVSPDAHKGDHMVNFEMGYECEVKISELKLPVIKVDGGI